MEEIIRTDVSGTPHPGILFGSEKQAHGAHPWFGPWVGTEEEQQQIMISRFYGNNIGRFLKPDNIITSITNPQGWNRYNYVLGNPVSLSDPTGHFVSRPGARGGSFSGGFWGSTLAGKIQEGALESYVKNKLWAALKIIVTGILQDTTVSTRRAKLGFGSGSLVVQALAIGHYNTHSVDRHGLVYSSVYSSNHPSCALWRGYHSSQVVDWEHMGAISFSNWAGYVFLFQDIYGLQTSSEREISFYYPAVSASYGLEGRIVSTLFYGWFSLSYQVWWQHEGRLWPWGDWRGHTHPATGGAFMGPSDCDCRRALEHWEMGLGPDLIIQQGRPPGPEQEVGLFLFEFQAERHGNVIRWWWNVYGF